MNPAYSYELDLRSYVGFDAEDVDFITNVHNINATPDGIYQGINIPLPEKAVWNGSYELDIEVPRGVRLLARVLEEDFKQKNMVFMAPGECEDLATDWNHFNACVAIVNATQEMSDPETRRVLPSGLIRDFAQYNITPTMFRMKDDIFGGAAEALQNACKDVHCEKAGAGNSCTNESLFINSTILSQHGSFSCQSDICSRVKALMTIDQDVGGIGVFISYCIQIFIGFVIAIYIIAKWIKRWWRQRRGILPPSAPINCSRAWVNFLLMFQKTQCWFISALVIAAFIRGGGNNISTIDAGLLLVLTLNGVVLVSFTLLAVTYMGGPRSWFNFSIVTMAYTLCSIFLGIAVSMDLEKTFNNTYRFCAPMINQLPEAEYIFDFLDGIGASLPDNVPIICLVFCTTVMLVMFIRQWGISRKIVPKTVGGFWQRHHRLMGSITVMILTVGYLGTMGFCIYLLSRYFKIINKKEWGFGQILAFTLWIPCFADFFQERCLEDDMERMARYRRRAALEEDLTSAPRPWLDENMKEKHGQPDYSDESHPLENMPERPKPSFESIAMESPPPAASSEHMLFPVSRERKAWANDNDDMPGNKGASAGRF